MSDRRERLLIALLTLAASSAVLLDLPEVVRVPVVLVFALSCPGMAWSRRLVMRSAGDRLALAVGVSVAALVVTGEAMALTGRWSDLAGTAGLAAFTTVGLVVRVRRSALDEAVAPYGEAALIPPAASRPRR